MVSLSSRLHFIILCTEPFFSVAGHYITTPFYKPCVYVHFSNWLAPETDWIEWKHFHFHFWVVVFIFLLLYTASFGGGELAGMLEMKRYCASGKRQQWKWMGCKDITVQTATLGHYIRITSNRGVNERARKRETMTETERGKKTTFRRCRPKCRKNAEDSCTVHDLINLLFALLQAFGRVFYVRYIKMWKIISIKDPVLKSDLFYS